MRPVIKRRRIDPRYFLHETANRKTLQEQHEEKPSKDQPPEEKPSKDQPPEQLPDCPRGQTYSKKERRCIKKVEEKMADKDYDGDGEVESSEEEWRGSKNKAVKKARGKKEHEKGANGKDRDPDTPGKQVLLKGEKKLYEKIRGAIEEIFNEYLEENK